MSYDNWKVWENYLYTSVDLGDFGEAIRGVSRILELKHKSVDVEVLRILQGAVTSDLLDFQGAPSKEEQNTLPLKIFCVV